MSDIEEQSPNEKPPVPAPPRLLQCAPSEHEAMSSMRESPDLVELHDQWAKLHAANPSVPAAGSGLHGKIRQQIGSVVVDVSEPVQRADRSLIGSLIRTNDSLAIRCDELAARVEELEALLRDVVATVSEDVVQIRASLEDISLLRPPPPGNE